ncbi:MAG TPA: tetratricopeptide repeat protein [Polyangiaceae bacterium]|jgi:tetratricopeptide (TPR) repeat protein|nr:tetratricopeptide repeat protein [Polyangiaceae bacterium]
MGRAHTLKKLPSHELDSAVQKAMLYRELNQPEEAESICQDVIAVDAKHQIALRVLGLAITDRFDELGTSFFGGLFEEAMKVFGRLENEYERVYHEGVAWERLGKAHLRRGEGHGALGALEHAIEHYERAEKIAPEGNPDPILRFNRCVRLLQSHRLLKDAFESPRSREPNLGD